MAGWALGAEAWVLVGAWALVMLLAVWLLVRGPQHHEREDAGEILRSRFARGELSEVEFRRATTALSSDWEESPRWRPGWRSMLARLQPRSAVLDPRPTHPRTRRSEMTDQEPVLRRDRRALERDSAHSAAADRPQTRGAARARQARQARLRKVGFGGIVVAVLAIGGVLAFGDFFNRPGDGATAGVIDVQSSMAGFNPSEIRVTAGETVTLNWWTQDAASHLEGGVHTMVAPDLGLDEALPAESTKTVTWTVPNTPGTYDVWCDSCCGGKDSPTMHGKIVVEPAAAA